VRNHRLPVRSIEARAETGGAYQTLERQEYNFFVGTNLGPGPFELRLTAQGGQQIIEHNVRLGDNVVVMGTQQFE
jgi:expansin (peptidoglycan-binding protein)